MVVKDFEVNLKLMTNFDCSIFFINKNNDKDNPKYCYVMLYIHA